jgi:hypothetical protein|nr:MAG TPA: hypothetical protein [Caudoviricetes sp.]DAR19322.1 MAG TPA: hypothetical protein [Caudoviricetes sp.]
MKDCKWVIILLVCLMIWAVVLAGVLKIGG